MKKFYLLFLLLFGILVVFWGCQEALTPDGESTTSDRDMVASPIYDEPGDIIVKCVRSPGYWKNHLEAWPADDGEFYETYFSGPTWSFTKEELQDLIVLKGQDKNKWFTMFRAVVAAQLDIQGLKTNNCWSDEFNTKINSVVSYGFKWMADYGPFVRAKEAAWQKKGERIYLELDAYYNGFLCDEAPACD